MYGTDLILCVLLLILCVLLDCTAHVPRVFGMIQIFYSCKLIVSLAVVVEAIGGQTHNITVIEHDY